MSNPQRNGDSDTGGGVNVLDLVDELEPLPPDERSSRLDRLGLTPEQRREVENCLRFNGPAGGFLERSPVDPGGFQVTVGEGSAAGEPELPGYRVVGKLGEGGMGTVWRAVQVGTRREVALKQMHVSRFGAERARARFDREVQIAARLEHPHIARVYDSGVYRGIYYYAMELVDGLPLDEYVQTAKLTRGRTLALMRTVCRAVQHAHQNGVIHRDLKPNNILVTKDGQPKVLDFGLARSLADDVGDMTVTGEGDVAGTPAYMSPEQAAGRGDRLDTRSDVYSLGVILYRLLTGKSPHDLTGTRLELLRRISEQEVTLDRSAALDKELRSVLLKALARERERRYATAAELAADLDRLLAGEPVSARPPTLLYVAQKRLRRHWLPFAAAAAMILSLVVTGVYFYAREVRQRRVAEDNRREAQLGLAQSKIAEGDALVSADNFSVARDRYDEARVILDRHGESTFFADLALWDSYRRSPPPLLELTGHGGRVNRVQFLRGDKEIISGSDDGTVRIWDGGTGRTLRVLAVGGKVQGLAVSPDGATVAVASVGGGLTRWDVETGSRRGGDGVTGFDGEPVSVAYSPDGGTLLVGTTHARRNAYLVDAGTGEVVRTFTGHTSPVRAVAFTPDGKVALTASGRGPDGDLRFGIDASLRAWDVAGGLQLWSADADAGRRVVEEIAVSPDGSTVLCGSYRGVATLWDVKTGGVRWRESVAEVNANGVAFSPDGALVAVASAANQIQVLWADTGRPLEGFHPRTVLSGAERSVSFSPDGRLLLAASDRTIRLFPVLEVNAHRSFTYGDSWTNHSDVEEVNSVSFSPGGRFALSTGIQKRSVRLWDLETETEFRSVSGSRPPAGQLHQHQALAAFLPDGSILLAEEGGRVAVWDDLLEKRLRLLDGSGDRKAAGLAVSSDGRRAAVSFWGSEEVIVYDVSTGSPWRSLTCRSDDGCSMAFSLDGARLAVCGYHHRGGVTVTLWDVEAGRELSSVEEQHVFRLAFSPDGSTLWLSGTTLRMLDVRSGTVTDASGPNVPLLGIEYLPHSVAGRDVLLLGTETPSIYFCRPTSGVLRQTDRLFSYAYDWAVSPGGTKLLAAARSATGNLQVIDLSYPARVRGFQARLVGARRALELDAEDGAALRTLGEWYALRQVWRSAADLLERAGGAGVDVAPGLLARCYVESGRDGKALPHLARAADRERGVPAQAWRKWYDDALSHTEAPEKRQSEARYMGRWFSHPYFVLARRHAVRGRWKQALQLTVAAAPREEPPADLKRFEFFLVSLALLGNGHLAENKQLLLAELAASPGGQDSTPVRWRLGASCYDLGEFAEAAGYLGEATAADPSYPHWHMLYGDVLWRLERREEAVAAWRRGLEACGPARERLKSETVQSQREARLAQLESLESEINERLGAVDKGERPAVQKTVAEIKAELAARSLVH